MSGAVDRIHNTSPVRITLEKKEPDLSLIDPDMQ